MRKITTREARYKFSTYLTQVEQGEEIIISRRGHKDVVMVSAEKFENLQSFKRGIKTELFDMLTRVDLKTIQTILPKLSELVTETKQVNK